MLAMVTSFSDARMRQAISVCCVRCGFYAISLACNCSEREHHEIVTSVGTETEPVPPGPICPKLSMTTALRGAVSTNSTPFGGLSSLHYFEQTGGRGVTDSAPQC